MKPMNRQQRRQVVNQVLNTKIASEAKTQYGIGLVITNLMFVITFWKWTWILRDRRLK